jgi:hypothetical protein
VRHPLVTKGNVTQHNHLGAITTEWAKCASPRVHKTKGTHRKTRMKGKTLRLPPHGAAAKTSTRTPMCVAYVCCAHAFFKAADAQ